MKKNEEKTKDIYLMNSLKFQNKEQTKLPINIEIEYKHKNTFLLNELTYLANSSLYIKELERLEKINKEKLMKLNMKVQVKKKINKKHLIKMYNIMRGSCNKMFLDLIYNNPKIKKIFFPINKTNFSNDSKYKQKLKIDSDNSKNYFKYKLEKCHTDSINLISGRNPVKHFKKSLSFFSPNNHNLFLKKKFSIMKSLSSEKMSNYYNSENNSKRNKHKTKKDALKGMLSINYNSHKNLINNLKKRYTHFRLINNIKL